MRPSFDPRNKSEGRQAQDEVECGYALPAGLGSGRDAGARGRYRGDGLEDLRGDLVGVALRIRAAVFQVALVAVVDEAVRHADRGATVGNAVAELVPRRRLVL